MPARFSDTERWSQKWYRTLPPDAKVVYECVYSLCDPAGFYEWDIEDIAFHTGLTKKRIERASEALANTFETNGQYVWIPYFIQATRNWPLKPKVAAHAGIIQRLEERMTFSPLVVQLLDGKPLPNGYEGLNIGLFSPNNHNPNRDHNLGTEPDYSETDELIDYLNQLSNSQFRHSKASREPIHARLADGASVEDVRLIFEHKCAQWLGDPQWEGYLNPETLCRPTKFERNLNAARKWAKAGRPSPKARSGPRNVARGRDPSEYGGGSNG